MDLDQLLSAPEPVLLDGAMGTELSAQGLPEGWPSVLSAPEAVVAVHCAYRDAGARALITNTLTANRIAVESHAADVDVVGLNRTAADLARRAAGDELCVLGNLSSTGKMLEPYGDLSELNAYDAFRQQAEALAEGGVDAFIIETMFDLREALCAVRACRDAAMLPVLASIAFQTEANGGRTIMGNAAAECATALADAGAVAVGANCGEITPREIAVIVAAMAASGSVPIIAEPNAGCPRLVDGRTVFDMAPDDFAAGMLDCIAAGATLVGGCCGTTPAHIAALAAG